MTGPAQVEMMLASYAASQDEADAEVEIPNQTEDYDTIASPADLEYNQVQYEPHELWPLDPNWPKASQGADLDVEIIGGSYAQQDGRYRYGFCG